MRPNIFSILDFLRPSSLLQQLVRALVDARLPFITEHCGNCLERFHDGNSLINSTDNVLILKLKDVLLLLSDI